MLGGDALEGDNEVFQAALLLLLLGALAVHHVVESNAVLQQVVTITRM